MAWSQPDGKAATWPDALTMANGARATSAQEFEAERRPELLNLFAENVYGKSPQEKLPMKSTVTSVDRDALGGLAVRKQVELLFSANGITRALHVLEYLPAKANGPAPVFVGLNFDGNWTVSKDAGIALTDEWTVDPALAKVRLSTELKGHFRQRATENERGKNASRWPLEMILRAGFGVATVYAGDIEPDMVTGIGYGVRPLFFKGDQYLPAADDWGAIGAWAWGLSRVADYLETDPAVNAKEMIVIGHSRLGKTALWAGAQDKRFAMVISNESGKGGASLSHRGVEESIAHLNIAFPYWFSANYHHYTGRQEKLPVDGHLLLALIAPRPLFVGSAQEDPYSDPHGEYLSTAAASEVYALYGEKGPSFDDQVELDKPVGNELRYYMRPGGHDMKAEDWKQYIAWAEEMLKKK
ncbi:MAG: acetylxylan esterase [Acidobacteriota bacterium]|nr:acetylxylan esterase [Acidobacteriota bacterium]